MPLAYVLVDPTSHMTKVIHSSVDVFILPLFGSMERYDKIAHEYDPSEHFTKEESCLFNKLTA